MYTCAYICAVHCTVLLLISVRITSSKNKYFHHFPLPASLSGFSKSTFSGYTCLSFDVFIRQVNEVHWEVSGLKAPYSDLATGKKKPNVLDCGRSVNSVKYKQENQDDHFLSMCNLS